MPFSYFEALSNNTYRDGQRITANDDPVEPVLVVRNAFGKYSVLEGVVALSDTTEPEGLESVTVAQGLSNRGHEILFDNLDAITDNVALSSIDVLYSTVDDSSTAASQQAELGLGYHVVTGLSEATRYFCWTVATDTSGNVAGPTPVSGGSIITADVTAPAFAAFEASKVFFDKIGLSWTLSDNYDVFPDVIISVYDSQFAATSSNVYWGSGSGFVSRILIPDGASANYYEYGSSVYGEPPLDRDKTHYFYAVSRDAWSNMTPAPLSASAATVELAKPSFDSLSVTCSDAVVSVSWDVRDVFLATNTVYVVNTSNEIDSVTAEDVMTHPSAVTSALDSHTITLSNVPAVSNSYVYAVIEDNWSEFGSTSNQVSEVSSDFFIVPEVISDPVSSQGRFNVLSAAGFTIRSQTAAASAVSSTYKAADVPADSEIVSVVTSSAHNLSRGSFVDTAPPVLQNMSAVAQNESTLLLSWDPVTDTADASPSLTISVYRVDAARTATNVLEGTGTGFLTKIDIPDTLGIVSYPHGNLEPATTYYFDAVARDASENVTPVVSFSGTTAAP